MDCYSFTNHLTDYLDNQLKLPQRREADAHLRECPVCREKVEEMSRLLNAMHSLRAVHASDSFEAVLMQKIRNHQDSLQNPRNFWTYLSIHSRTFSAAAALMLVMAGTLIIWRGYNPRLENFPPVMNSAPVLSSVGSSGSTPKQRPPSNLVNPIKKSASMALKDTVNSLQQQDKDTFKPEDFRNRIQLVNDRR